MKLSDIGLFIICLVLLTVAIIHDVDVDGKKDGFGKGDSS